MKAGQRWTEAEIQRIRELAALGFQSPQIASLIGRTQCGVSHQCTQHGIRLTRKRNYGTAPADRSIWNDADRLSMHADIPHELAEFIVETAEYYKLELKKLRSDRKTRKLVRCRQRIAVIARQSGYSYPIIGRALNRDHTTVAYAVKTAKSTGFPQNPQSSAFVPCADQSKVAA